MPNPSTVAYRRDIDGLRAIAVLLVLVNHVAPGFLPGGFVGVDVFFVISGFLMTGIIDSTQRDGSFRFVVFLWRRSRRIMPPLLCVLGATLLAGLCIMTAPELTSLARHSIAGSLSLSNLLLFSEVGYFDAAAAFKPLLHLWSLGVEEQFYLLWPLLLATLPLRGPRRVLSVTAVTLLSFMVSDALAWSERSHAFYLLHSRVWEFGLGAVLALCIPHTAELPALSDHLRRVVHHVCSTIGLGCLVVAAIAVNDQTTWPGMAALIPVVGTLLLIASGPRAAFNTRVLSSTIAQWIGKRSYALYLWHWPPLAFLHVLAAERGMSAMEVTTWSALMMLPVLAMAHFTFQYIERPARARADRLERCERIGLRHLRPYAFGLTGIAAASALILSAGGLPIRYGAGGTDVSMALTAASPDSIAAYERDATRCALADRGSATWCRRVGDRGPGIAVIGDSHAEVIFAGLHALDASQQMLLSGRKGCAPILQSETIGDATAEICRRSALLAHEAIRSDDAISTVLIASRGPAYLSGVGYGVDTLHRVVPVTLGDTLAMRQAFESGLVRAVARFRAAGKRVILVLGVPEMGFLPDQCLVGRPFGLRRIRIPCALRRSDFDRRNAVYRDLVARVQARVAGVEVFDPAQIFCDGALCRATSGGALLYSDGNHLTLTGSRRVARQLLPLLVPVPAVPALTAMR